MDNKINNSLIRIYQTLKFTDKEIKETLDKLAQVQQMALSTELLGSLNKEEIEMINGSLQKSDAEKAALIEQIAKSHIADNDFIARAEAVAKKELDDHLAYLKTRGDDNQKSIIAAIVAEIE